MAPLRRLISSVLIFSFLTTVLLGPSRRLTRASTRNERNVAVTADEEYGLQFRLSDGTERRDAGSTTKVTPATELSESETEKILQRLPPMTVEPVVQDFALRENSLPPPRTGNTVETSFPAATNDAVAPVTAGPLEVVRYSPEGRVPIAPELSITFSQPMVQLTSQEEAATNVPVKLTPQPPGKWRWLGTKTLIFESQDRLPMATTFVVTVPTGTRAVNGSKLATEKSWSFTTPPLTVKAAYPSNEGTYARDTLMFMEFDQRIDHAAVLPAVRVTSGGRVLKPASQLRTKSSRQSIAT